MHTNEPHEPQDNRNPNLQYGCGTRPSFNNAVGVVAIALAAVAGLLLWKMLA